MYPDHAQDGVSGDLRRPGHRLRQRADRDVRALERLKSPDEQEQPRVRQVQSRSSFGLVPRNEQSPVDPGRNDPDPLGIGAVQSDQMRGLDRRRCQESIRAADGAHTPGSTCFLLEGHPVLFSGDTLFPGGPGNTKFENASFDTIITSIDRRLFTLDPETLVLPGHGLDTTIGTERPHLDEWIERGW